MTAIHNRHSVDAQNQSAKRSRYLHDRNATLVPFCLMIAALPLIMVGIPSILPVGPELVMIAILALTGWILSFLLSSRQTFAVITIVIALFLNPWAQSWHYIGVTLFTAWAPLVLILGGGRLVRESKYSGTRLDGPSYVPERIAVLAVLFGSLLQFASQGSPDFLGYSSLVQYVAPILMVRPVYELVTAASPRITGEILLTLSALIGLIAIIQVTLVPTFLRYDIFIRGFERVSDAGQSGALKAVVIAPYGTVYANLMAILLPLAIVFIRHCSAATLRNRHYVFIALSSVGILLSYERLSTIVGLTATVVALLYKQQLPSKFKLATGGSAFVALLAVNGLFTPLLDRLFGRKTSGGSTTVDVRFAATETGLRAALDNPFGLGIGKSASTFLDYSVTGNQSASPHNGVLYLAVELGWIPALAIVIWIIYRGYVRGNLWLTAPVSAPMFASLYSESMPAHPQIWWLIPLPIVAAMILNGTEKNKVGISR